MFFSIRDDLYRNWFPKSLGNCYQISLASFTRLSERGESTVAALRWGATALNPNYSLSVVSSPLSNKSGGLVGFSVIRVKGCGAVVAQQPLYASSLSKQPGVRG